MKDGFRQAMAWLHTWTGLLFGWLLFAIFLTGTLSYFKEEITHWMQPEIGHYAPNPQAALAAAQRYLQGQAPASQSWFIRLPNEREAGVKVGYRDANGGPRGFVTQTLDAKTGEPVTARDSRGGEFFYRFHFQLQMPYPYGRWLSTFCALIMLLGLVTGIITHKKLFKEFFTFRPGKGQRSWLDGHNAIGVLVLPFHLMISYSSLVLFMYLVMPAGLMAHYGDDTSKYFNDLFGAGEAPKAAQVAAPLAPLPALYAQVQALQPGARVGNIRVENPGDSNARVTFTQSAADHVAYRRSANWTFDGATGALLEQGKPESGAMLTAFSFAGLHMGNFAGPWLRWLYFCFGLAGTAVIGTGLVMWLDKRQLKHAKAPRVPRELRLVEVLNIVSMSGLLLAVASFFWANRLLPAALETRADWEVSAFFMAWGLALVHAMVRSGRRAWGEQLALGALAFTLLPLLNALTTAHGLNHAIIDGDWSMAGFDLTALGCGLFLAWLASKKLRPALALAKPSRSRASQVGHETAQAR